jgi:hypothetical protein
MTNSEAERAASTARKTLLVARERFEENQALEATIIEITSSDSTATIPPSS